MVREIERQDRGKHCPGAISYPAAKTDVSLGPLGSKQLKLTSPCLFDMISKIASENNLARLSLFLEEKDLHGYPPFFNYYVINSEKLL